MFDRIFRLAVNLHQHKALRLVLHLQEIEAGDPRFTQAAADVFERERDKFRFLPGYNLNLDQDNVNSSLSVDGITKLPVILSS